MTGTSLHVVNDSQVTLMTETWSSMMKIMNNMTPTTKCQSNVKLYRNWTKRMLLNVALKQIRKWNRNDTTLKKPKKTNIPWKMKLQNTKTKLETSPNKSQQLSPDARVPTFLNEQSTTNR